MHIAYLYRLSAAFGTLSAALILMTWPAVAQTTTVVTGGDAWPAIAPVVSILAESVIAIAIAWASAWASRKWGIDIEAKHREQLHSSAKTGVQAMLAKLAPTAGSYSVNLKSQILAGAVKWMFTSGPDAVKYFKLEDKADKLEEIALRYLNEATTPKLNATPIAQTSPDMGGYSPSPHR